MRGQSITTTTQLQETIKDALQFLQSNVRQEQIKKACQRCFQALRIAVNDEFGALEKFLEKLPKVLEKLNQDAAYILENDPASNAIEEIYLAYPGFYAIAIYRLSHELYLLDLLLFSRLMSEYAHRITGTDIHAGATIASPFFIDHATGIVIGETTVIEKNVKIYQGVTLGALSVSKDMKNSKRHPTVEKNVCIYANATILGGQTTIGKNSIIGGNTLITKSIPSNSVVTNTTITEVKIKEL